MREDLPVSMGECVEEHFPRVELEVIMLYDGWAVHVMGPGFKVVVTDTA